MKDNSPSSSGATATASQTELRRDQQQQEQTSSGMIGSPFDLERVPQLGQNVLFRPKDHNTGRVFTGYIFAILAIRDQENAQETRVSLRYLDQAGQPVDAVNVRLGMEPGCFAWNTGLERANAQITKSWLRQWGYLPQEGDGEDSGLRSVLGSGTEQVQQRQTNASATNSGQQQHPGDRPIGA